MFQSSPDTNTPEWAELENKKETVKRLSSELYAAFKDLAYYNNPRCTGATIKCDVTKDSEIKLLINLCGKKDNSENIPLVQPVYMNSK